MFISRAVELQYTDPANKRRVHYSSQSKQAHSLDYDPPKESRWKYCAPRKYLWLK